MGRVKRKPNRRAGQSVGMYSKAVPCEDSAENPEIIYDRYHNDEKFKELLRCAIVYFKLSRKCRDDEPKPGSSKTGTVWFTVGRFELTLNHPDELLGSDVNELCLYIADNDQDGSFLYCESSTNQQDYRYEKVDFPISPTASYLRGVKPVSVRLSIADISLSGDAARLTVKVSLNYYRCVVDLSLLPSNLSTSILEENKSILRLVQMTDGDTIPEGKETTTFPGSDVANFLTAISQLHRTPEELSLLAQKASELESFLKQSALLPDLRGYQLDAVNWMLDRETSTDVKYAHSDFDSLFTQLPCGLHYNEHSGLIIPQLIATPNKTPVDTKLSLVSNLDDTGSKREAMLTQADQKLLCTAGGILADEMGLGKTVEILALIICNPRDQFGKFTPSINSNISISESSQSHSNNHPPNTPSNPDQENATSSNLVDSSEILSGADQRETFNSDPVLPNSSECDNQITTNLSNLVQSESRPTSTSKLYEVKSPSSDELKPSDKLPIIECLCGEEYRYTNLVCCTSCLRYQHVECVGWKCCDTCKYLCPHCHSKYTSLEGRATLIVVPVAILHQWREEIEKHINQTNFTVLIYEGLSRRRYIQPCTLAIRDVVITTYETLLREVNFSGSSIELGSKRSMRGRKRYMAPPTPLTTINWWRMCVDEAQMVESSTSKVSEMAARLDSVNRWCVTGTPLQVGLNDLAGLFAFLRLQPLSNKSLWEAMFYKPYCRGLTSPTQSIAKHYMWRTNMADVRQQIGLSSLKELTHYISLTAVEEVFYRQQYQACKADCLNLLNKLAHLGDVRLDELDRYNLSELLTAMLKMRQACCHPSIVRSQHYSLPTTLTIDELLEQMTKRVNVECEEAQRKIVAGLNGRAACFIMEGKFNEAIDKYEEALKQTKERVNIRTDPLQLVHTLYNLREMLLAHKSSSLEDVATLLSQQNKLIAEYQEKSDSKATEVGLHVQQLEDDIMQYHLAKRSGKVDFWWTIDGSVWIDFPSLYSSITDAVTIDVSFKNLNGLQYYLVTEWTTLQGHYQTARNAVHQLSNPVLDPDLIQQVVSCCLRPITSESNSKKKCVFCETSDLLEKYEHKLFLFSYSHMDEHGELQMKGTWADSMLETVLKCVYRQAVHRLGTYHSTVVDGRDHIQLIETMKKHFKPLRALWVALRERVSAADEIIMSQIRFRIRDEGEEVPDDVAYVIERDALQQHTLKQLNQIAEGRMDLEQHLRQLNYLQNLSKQAENPELAESACPICTQPMGDSWAVLRCCHSFCMDCISTLIACGADGRLLSSLITQNRSLKCAICRQITPVSDVSYVASKPKVNEPSAGVCVQGNYSSKITEVILRIKLVEQSEPRAKILIFSSWPALFDVLEYALEQNDVSYTKLSGSKSGARYQRNLQQFRKEERIEVLLLPVHSGANGLNLVEANHVMFLERLLSPGVQAQAIGRIQRIGQTRQTYVHHFIVKSTIEEKISNLTESHPETSSIKESLPLTLSDIRDLFN